MIPLFPELRPLLLEAFEAEEEGTQYVVTHCRDSRTNLRTHMHRIIRRAGLEPWAMTFQNLGSTRETELADLFPIHVVCKWIGNRQPIAAKDYLQLTDEHFNRAVTGIDETGVKAAQNPAQKLHETLDNHAKQTRWKKQQVSDSSEAYKQFPASSEYFTDSIIPRTGRCDEDVMGVCFVRGRGMPARPNPLTHKALGRVISHDPDTILTQDLADLKERPGVSQVRIGASVRRQIL